jgi:hypothetical protein
MLPALWAPLQAGVRASVPALVLQSGTFNKLLLLLLMVLSISTWAVIVERFRLLGRVRKADRAFRAAFAEAANLAEVRLLASQHPGSLQAKLALEGLGTLLPRGEVPTSRPRRSTWRAGPWSARVATSWIGSSATSASSRRSARSVRSSASWAPCGAS